MATLVLSMEEVEAGVIRTVSLVIILVSSGTESAHKTSLSVALLMTNIHILIISTQEVDTWVKPYMGSILILLVT